MTLNLLYDDNQTFDLEWEEQLFEKSNLTFSLNLSSVQKGEN